MSCGCGEVIKLERFQGKCYGCAHHKEQKAISSIVFQNSPCFDCVFNVDMPKRNRFQPIRVAVTPNEKKTADVLPFKKKEIVNV